MKEQSKQTMPQEHTQTSAETKRSRWAAVRVRGLEWGRNYAKYFIPLFALLFLYVQAHSFIREMKPAVAFHLLIRLKPLDHLELAAISGAAVLVMSAYDFLLLRWNRAKLPALNVLKISWIANTFNNTMGFAGFTGAGLRLSLYRKWGLQGSKWLRSMVRISMAGITGLSLMSLLLLLGVWTDGGMLRDHPWLIAAEIALSAYAVLYMLLDRLPLLRGKLGLQEERGDGSVGIPLAAVAASFVEWFAAGLAFWTVIHVLHLPIGFREAMGVYALAAAAGIASFMPGGLGSFDAAALLCLHAYGVSSDQAFAALLLFRIFYYLLPWCVGLALASTEWMPGKDRWAQAQNQVLKPAVKRWLTLWNWPSQTAIVRDMSNWALAALVFIGGLLLLVSAAAPGHLHRMRDLEHYVTPLTMKFSHQLTVVVGLLMLVVSDGIRLRVRRAYYFTLSLLAVGAIVSLLKGLDYEQAAFLICIFLLLWLSKDRFIRKEIGFTARKTAVWAGVTLIVTALYWSLGHVVIQPLAHNEPHARWLRYFALKDYELRRESALALAASWLLLSLRWLLRPSRPPMPTPDTRDWAKLQSLLAKHDGNFLTHLLFLGDKSLLWTPDGRAVLAYGRSGSTLVALGDPIGAPEAARELVGQFRDYADRYNATPVFYQVKADSLPLYHEFGLRFFKLGEEAVIPLDSFQLGGRRRADLRAAYNRYEKSGHVFEVVPPPFSPALMSELREVSEEWLGGRAEKTFSLGLFKESYVELAPIALLRDGGRRVVAFATMMPVYDGGASVSIDLMRHRRGLSGVMDALLVHVLLWSKEQGYRQFNLGMAPLGMVGEYDYAFKRERIARWVFRKGNYFYGFQGIRRFKDKYDPNWEPRYLAFPANASFAKVIVNVTRLISRKSKPD